MLDAVDNDGEVLLGIGVVPAHKRQGVIHRVVCRVGVVEPMVLPDTLLNVGIGPVAVSLERLVHAEVEGSVLAQSLFDLLAGQQVDGDAGAGGGVARVAARRLVYLAAGGPCSAASGRKGAGQFDCLVESHGIAAYGRARRRIHGGSGLLVVARLAGRQVGASPLVGRALPARKRAHRMAPRAARQQPPCSQALVLRGNGIPVQRRGVSLAKRAVLVGEHRERCLRKVDRAVRVPLRDAVRFQRCQGGESPACAVYALITQGGECAGHAQVEAARQRLSRSCAHLHGLRCEGSLLQRGGIDPSVVRPLRVLRISAVGTQAALAGSSGHHGGLAHLERVIGFRLQVSEQARALPAVVLRATVGQAVLELLSIGLEGERY